MSKGRFMEGTLERTARLLSQNYGVKLKFEGNKCQTDGDTIVLPNIPDDAPKPLLDAIRGFVDHEVGHVVGSDDVRTVETFIQGKNLPDKNQEKILTNIIQMVEDRQVDNRVKKTWPGTRKNLQDMYSYCADKANDKWEEFSTFDEVLHGLIAKFADFDPDVHDSQMSDEAKEIVDSVVNDYQERIADLHSTSDSLELGYEMFESIKEFFEDPPPPEAGEDDEEDDSEQQSPQQGGKGGGEGDGQQTGNGDSEGEESEDGEEGEGDSEGGSSKSGGDQEDDSGGSSDSEGDADGEGEGKPEQGGTSQAQANTSMADFTTGVNDPLKSAIEENLAAEEVQAEKDHNYQHNLHSDNTYIPYTKEYDKVDPIRIHDRQGALRQVDDIRKRSTKYTKIIKRRLVNSLRASKKSYWIGGRETGRLNTRRLHRVPAGVTSGLYKQKIEKKLIDTCVGIMVDHSGSMYGDPLELSQELSITLGDAFTELQIPFFEAGFTTDAYAVPDYPRDTDKYARWGGLRLYNYSDFDDNWREASMRLGQMHRASGENTLEGESILWGAQKLYARPEVRKLLLVFCDGYPWPGRGNPARCQKYFKKVVKEAGKHGIDVVGFGIQTDAVKHYFPQYVVINHLSDVVKQPLVYLDNYLREGMNKK